MKPFRHPDASARERRTDNRHPDASVSERRTCFCVTAVATELRRSRSSARIRMTVLGLAFAAPISAQRAPANVPIRPLGAVVSTSTISFQQIQHLRALSNGKVLINDPGKRQVILLDSALTNPKVVVDSAGGANMYGMNAGALIPFAGDSTLFVDRSASAFLVIDPEGKVARVMSMPPGNAPTYLTNPSAYGYPGYSSKLGIVYRLPMPRPQIQRPQYGEPEIL